MTQFHEGQEVEVAIFAGGGGRWRKAKIVECMMTTLGGIERFEVEFVDGTRAVFNAGRIRPARDGFEAAYDDALANER